MGLNSLNIDGRLVRDSEVRTSQAGKPYTNMRIAFDTWNAMKKEREPNFISVRVFRALQLPKGQAVMISGKLEIKEYEKEGQRVTFPQIVAFDCTPIQFVKVEQPAFGGAAPQESRVGNVVNAFGGTVQPSISSPSPAPASSPIFPSDSEIPF